MLLFIYNYCKWKTHLLFVFFWNYISLFQAPEDPLSPPSFLCCFVCERKCPLLAYLKNSISSIENRFRILLIQQIIRIYMALSGKIKPHGNNKDWQLYMINRNSLASREKIMMYFSSEAYQHLTKLGFVFLAHYKNSNSWISLGGREGVERQTAARTFTSFCFFIFFDLI